MITAAALRAVAYGLVVAMVAGSLLWLYLDWEAGASVVTVQVINANTGDVTLYQARREHVEGRRFTTLDGRIVDPGGCGTHGVGRGQVAPCPATSGVLIGSATARVPQTNPKSTLSAWENQTA